MNEPAKLDEFERAVYGRTHDPETRQKETNAALMSMLQVMYALKYGQGFEGYPKQTTALFTRFCSAVVALFCDPAFKVTQAGFDAVCAERGILEACFAASSYGNSDYVFNLFEPDEGDATKFLLLFQTNSSLQYDIESVFRMDPQATFGLYLSLLGYGQVFTQAGHERRERLLEMWPIFEAVRLEPALINALAAAYMHCSYAIGEGKHAPKALFHRLMAASLSEVVKVPDLEPLCAQRKARPVVVVPLEWWNCKHAMYRCYAQSLRQLRDDFHLIGIGMNADDESKSVFHEWIEVDSKEIRVAEIAKRINEIAPDVIYYPSIGMAAWTMGLASLRLAPLQVMSYGHPATSGSKEIDYGFLEADLVVKDRFTERIVSLPPNTVRFVPFEEKIPATHRVRKTDTVKIAVTAMQVKVTWPLIRCLQEVQKRSAKKIEVHFFGATAGVGLYAFAKTVEGLLSGTKVYEKAGYGEYIKWISECDICLFSFPFGGTNTCIDAMQMGMPMVVLEGNEPHSRTDSTLIRRAGLPEYWIAKNEREYVERILALTDDVARESAAAALSRVDVAELFFAKDEGMEFRDKFLHLYRCSTLEKAA